MAANSQSSGGSAAEAAAIEQDLSRLFSILDADGTGYLTPISVLRVFRSFGADYTEHEVKDIIAQMHQKASRGGSGGRGAEGGGGGAAETRSITEETRSTTGRKGGGSGAGRPEAAVSREDFAALLSQTWKDCSPEQELRETFDALDGDRDGTISAADLERHIAVSDAAAKSKWTPEKIAQLVREADVDGDKRLSFRDFEIVMGKL